MTPTRLERVGRALYDLDTPDARPQDRDKAWSIKRFRDPYMQLARAVIEAATPTPSEHERGVDAAAVAMHTRLCSGTYKEVPDWNTRTSDYQQSLRDRVRAVVADYERGLDSDAR